jgi:hypothetical protein
MAQLASNQYPSVHSRSKEDRHDTDDASSGKVSDIFVPQSRLYAVQLSPGLWRFFAVLRWFTQKTLQDGEIIAQFGRLLAGRL